mmetsp:Transcript_14099/g.41469  ORF Transcript_14099/g.41469 Transcript_14099/m.41469 type:complete len:225 (+) Transcript_14099:1078-1752(+)
MLWPLDLRHSGLQRALLRELSPSLGVVSGLPVPSLSRQPLSRSPVPCRSVSSPPSWLPPQPLRGVLATAAFLLTWPPPQPQRGAACASAGRPGEPAGPLLRSSRPCSLSTDSSLRRSAPPACPRPSPFPPCAYRPCGSTRPPSFLPSPPRCSSRWFESDANGLAPCVGCPVEIAAGLHPSARRRPSAGSHTGPLILSRGFAASLGWLCPAPAALLLPPRGVCHR